MNPIVEVNIQSEIGKLNGVIIHTPGEEVENTITLGSFIGLYKKLFKMNCPILSALLY